MAFDVSGMADFAKTDGKVIIQDLVMTGQSFKILPVQFGIKSSDKLIDFAVGTTELQEGDYSGFENFSGGAVLKDKTISVKQLFVKEKYNASDLDAKITQVLKGMGSNPEDFPQYYAQILTGLKGKAVANKNEMLLWQGDTTKTTDTTLKHFNGFVKQLTTAADYTKTGTAAAALVKGADAIAAVDAVYDKGITTFPEWLLYPTAMFMSPMNFKTYYRSLFKLNVAVDALTLQSAGDMMQVTIPGTSCTIYAMAGLTGSNDIFMTRPENFVIGCDLRSEMPVDDPSSASDYFKFQYLKEYMAWSYFALYKYGCAIARTNEVIRTEASA